MHRLISILVLPVLLALIGCDRFTGTLLNDGGAIEDVAFDITVEHRLPVAGIQQGSFRTGGALQAHGTVTGNPWTERDYWVGYRQFTSATGTFQLVVEAAPTRGAHATLARGTFYLTGGAEAHRDLTGRGTYTLLRDDRGVLKEHYNGTLE